MKNILLPEFSTTSSSPSSRKSMTADWREVLSTHCQAHWDELGKAVMLSRVPNILEDAGVNLNELLLGRKLRPFLEAEGQGFFRVIQSERNHILWGIVPNSAAVTPPYDRYFVRTEKDRPLRFAPSAWKAFTLPIPHGQRRWLTDEPSVQFMDLPEESTPGPGYEVERRFVVDKENDSEVDQAMVVARIAEWAVEHKIDPARFALGRKRIPAPRVERPSVSGTTGLDQLLALLLPGELTRISLPLDVVARLQSVKTNSSE